MSDPMYNAQKALFADRLFDGQKWHSGRAVLIDGTRIRGLARHGEVPGTYVSHVLAQNVFLAPGFVDLQVNGGGGILLNDNPSVEAMLAIAQVHRTFGTTSCLPTFITDTRERTQTAIAVARETAGRKGILGLHLEGPFINPARAGVHRRDHILSPEMSDLEWLVDLHRAGESLVTLAPECVPRGFIRALTERGIRVAAGHSEATAADMQWAIEEGLTGVTHLFNAMPAFSGRAPGIVGTAMGEPRLVAGLIADGIHVNPFSMRAAFAAKGAKGIALVTDAMPSVGAAFTEFALMGTRVVLQGGALRRDDGTLAGAHLDLASAVRNTVNLAGVAIEDALAAASFTPAAFLGLESERGHLAVGAYADIVALNKELQVQATWAEGREWLPGPDSNQRPTG